MWITQPERARNRFETLQNQRRAYIHPEWITREAEIGAVCERWLDQVI